jgi:hypothetical protein
MSTQADPPSFVRSGFDPLKINEEYTKILYLQDRTIVSKTKRSNYVLDQNIMFCQVTDETVGCLESYQRFSRARAR